MPLPSPRRRLISSELEAKVVLALLLLGCGGLDWTVDNSAILSAASSTSCTPFGGVDIGVSESVVSSYNVRLSPLLRGLETLLDRAAMSAAILENGSQGIFGSDGIGLLGSLESQLGMLRCRCCVMVEEKEDRCVEARGWDGAAIGGEYMLVDRQCMVVSGL